MTTDRPAAPVRGTALADRASRGGTQAPPTDAFSALLGAAAPKSDAPARRDDRPAQRDEPRRDARSLERRPHGPGRDEYRRPDATASDVPADEAIDTSCDPEAPAESLAAAAAASLFALQLASPLPPATATPAATAAPTTATPAAPVPALPILSSIVPASVATATTATVPANAGGTTTVAGEVAAVPTMPAEPAPPAAVAASAVAAVPADASAAGSATADGEVELPEHLLKPQTPAATAQDTATATHAQTGSDAESSRQPSTPSPTPAPAPAPTAAAPAAPPKADAPAEPAGPAAAAQPVSPAPAAPAGPAAASGLPHVERAVPLSRAVATTGVLIQLASERGITHARLNLKPVELGGIEVKLHSTPAGIHAQLVAESPEAARMLAQAGDDLKRQLEDRNVNLLSLDVSTSSDRRDDQPRFADGFGDDHRPGGHPSASRGTREDTVLMESPAAVDTVLVLPDGVHVDVLA